MTPGARRYRLRARLRELPRPPKAGVMLRRKATKRGGQGGAAHAPPHAYPHDAALRPTRPSDVDSASGRTGGNVLFLALAISFVVAVVMLVLVWVLFLR
jgi:hypothetical protein